MWENGSQHEVVKMGIEKWCYGGKNVDDYYEFTW